MWPMIIVYIYNKIVYINDFNVYIILGDNYLSLINNILIIYKPYFLTFFVP